MIPLRRCPSALVRYLAIALSICVLVALFSGPSLGKLAPAGTASRPELEMAVPPAATDLEAGKQLYDAGRWLEALEFWQRAEAEAGGRGDRLTQARALRYRVMALQALSQWSAAESVLAQAWAIAQAFGPKLSSTADAQLLLAQLQITEGNLALAQGKADAALVAFETGEQWYEQMGDRTGLLLSRLNQAEALQALGFYPRARRRLTDLQAQLQAEPDSRLKGRSLRHLSSVLQAMGELDAAGQALDNSQQIFAAVNDPNELAETLFQQGQLAQAQQQWAEAERLYGLSQTLSTQIEGQFKSASQRIRVVLRNPATQLEQTAQDQSQAIAQAIALLSHLDRLPPSHWRFYTQINLAQSLLTAPNSATATATALPLAQSLARATTQAHSLQDLRAESYLLAQLGHLYEQQTQYSDALRLSRQALSLARQINADDMTASWLWQTGRILAAQGQTQAAIAPTAKPLACSRISARSWWP
ncbi:MAG: hypothetical protein HC771_21810 [Synechococcales cyanobacterium CRU_2_2]|nr:hypothetical protein [Synechococcales cyanobacterium CRU_2_2]